MQSKGTVQAPARRGDVGTASGPQLTALRRQLRQAREGLTLRGLAALRQQLGGMGTKAAKTSPASAHVAQQAAFHSLALAGKVERKQLTGCSGEKLSPQALAAVEKALGSPTTFLASLREFEGMLEQGALSSAVIRNACAFLKRIKFDVNSLAGPMAGESSGLGSALPLLRWMALAVRCTGMEPISDPATAKQASEIETVGAEARSCDEGTSSSACKSFGSHAAPVHTSLPAVSEDLPSPIAEASFDTRTPDESTSLDFSAASPAHTGDDSFADFSPVRHLRLEHLKEVDEPERNFDEMNQAVEHVSSDSASAANEAHHCAEDEALPSTRSFEVITSAASDTGSASAHAAAVADANSGIEQATFPCNEADSHCELADDSRLALVVDEGSLLEHSSYLSYPLTQDPDGSAAFVGQQSADDEEAQQPAHESEEDVLSSSSSEEAPLPLELGTTLYEALAAVEPGALGQACRSELGVLRLCAAESDVDDLVEQEVVEDDAEANNAKVIATAKHTAVVDPTVVANISAHDVLHSVEDGAAYDSRVFVEGDAVADGDRECKSEVLAREEPEYVAEADAEATTPAPTAIADDDAVVVGASPDHDVPAVFLGTFAGGILADVEAVAVGTNADLCENGAVRDGTNTDLCENGAVRDHKIELEDAGDRVEERQVHSELQVQQRDVETKDQPEELEEADAEATTLAPTTVASDAAVTVGAPPDYGVQEIVASAFAGRISADIEDAAADASADLAESAVVAVDGEGDHNVERENADGDGLEARQVQSEQQAQQRDMQTKEQPEEVVDTEAEATKSAAICIADDAAIAVGASPDHGVPAAVLSTLADGILADIEGVDAIDTNADLAAYDAVAIDGEGDHNVEREDAGDRVEERQVHSEQQAQQREVEAEEQPEEVVGADAEATTLAPMTIAVDAAFTVGASPDQGVPAAVADGILADIEGVVTIRTHADLVENVAVAVDGEGDHNVERENAGDRVEEWQAHSQQQAQERDMQTKEQPEEVVEADAEATTLAPTTIADDDAVAGGAPPDHGVPEVVVSAFADGILADVKDVDASASADCHGNAAVAVDGESDHSVERENTGNGEEARQVQSEQQAQPREVEANEQLEEVEEAVRAPDLDQMKESSPTGLVGSRFSYTGVGACLSPLGLAKRAWTAAPIAASLLVANGFVVAALLYFDIQEVSVRVPHSF